MTKKRVFTWRFFNGLRAILYALMIPVAYMLGWLDSVPLVNVLSVIALVESAIAAWRADVPNRREDLDG